MPNWRAVGVGLTVELFLGFVGLLLPGIGQLFAGLIGGFVAGYIASTTVRSGLWHGLLAGSLGGFLLAIPLGVLVGVASIGIGLVDQLGGLVAGVGTTVLVVVIAVILGANSALGGGVGGFVKGTVVSRRNDRQGATARRQRSRPPSAESERDQRISSPNREDSSDGSTLVESIRDQR